MEASSKNDNLNQREAAALIGRHARFLQRRDKAGTGPANCTQGRERIYSRAGVLAWARAQGLLP